MHTTLKELLDNPAVFTARGALPVSGLSRLMPEHTSALADLLTCDFSQISELIGKPVLVVIKRKIHRHAPIVWLVETEDHEMFELFDVKIFGDQETN